MSIGVDISSDVLRFSLIENNNTNIIEKFSVSGLIPIKNESFIWNNPEALRNSKLGPYISISDVWNEFILDKDSSSSYSWTTSSKIKNKDYHSNLIIDSIIQNLKETKDNRTILSVDNSLSEFQQESLVKSLKQKGLVKSALLWRPVAIALHHLKELGRDNFKEGDILTVVDFDSHKPEVTNLKLKYLRDELVPVRTLPDSENVVDTEYNSFKLKRSLINLIINNDKNKYNQLLNGPFAHKFMSFLEGNGADDIFLIENLIFEPFKLDEKWISEIPSIMIDGTNFDNIKKDIYKKYNLQKSKSVLWNGFPCRAQGSDLLKENEYLIKSNGVSNGAADYAKRLNENKPTYLDMLPGIKMLSFIKENNSHHDFFDIIKKGEVEGGKIQRIPEPLTRFSYKHDEPTFTILLQDATTEEYKKQDIEMPQHSYDENIPLIIRAEMRPANGNATVTIEGGEGFENLFGSQQRLTLDWRRMESYELPETYSGPEVYPRQGRIAFCPETLRIAKEFLDNNLSLNSYVTFYGVQKTFKFVFGEISANLLTSFNQEIYCDNAQPLSMFGSKDEDNEEIKTLSEKISERLYETNFDLAGDANECTCQTPDFICRNCNNAKRHGFLNKMHFYAPDTYRIELRSLYNLENPKISWNACYSPGRVFSKSADFELFVDFIIEKSENNGYPDYPNTDCTTKYFWSFFRSLCWYKDTVLIPKEKVEKILYYICNYVINRNLSNNDKKFILCAILFSLRFRRIDSNFLKIDSDIFNKITYAIESDITPTDFPQTMMTYFEAGDNFNQYVLRFVRNEASETDFSALQGMITAIN